jgi:hypothetical protein
LSTVIPLGCLALFLFFNREPSYNGKTLTEWIYSLGGRPGWPAQPFDDERVKAIKHFGENAVPRLLEFIAASDGPFKTKVIRFVNHQVIIRCTFIRPTKSAHALMRFLPISARIL